MNIDAHFTVGRKSDNKCTHGTTTRHMGQRELITKPLQVNDEFGSHARSTVTNIMETFVFAVLLIPAHGVRVKHA